MPSLSSLISKRLLLGLTGGIAAYKAAELARLLVQEGATVQTVMTASAGHFIGAATLQALTGKPVFTDLWQANISNNMAHINFSREMDAILVAPASANFIAKLANGLADDLLTTLCLARDCPILIAPAMNRQMWENPATQRNLATLQNDGVKILGPASGEQACGEFGMGRMLEASELTAEMHRLFQPKWLQDKRLLITAGPTFEAIDAVRGITNISSGKMGYALAGAALEAGATVTLVSGPVCLSPPVGAKCVNVVCAKEMLAAVKNEVSHVDIFISVAAVADFSVAMTKQNKIKKTMQPLTLELVPNPDILAFVTGLSKAPFCVGFSAETEDLEKNAEMKRRKKKLPLIVANLAKEAIGADESALVLLDDEDKQYLPTASKICQARHLVKHIAQLYQKLHY